MTADDHDIEELAARAAGGDTDARNALLSRIAGTTPGHLTFNGTLALRVFAWGVVPLLGVAAAQYPTLANTLFHWLEPFTRALR
jgi:hypothetical protein